MLKNCYNQDYEEEWMQSGGSCQLFHLPLADWSHFSLNGDTAESDYLDSLFKVEDFPVDLVADHSCVHFRIHHFNG